MTGSDDADAHKDGVLNGMTPPPGAVEQAIRAWTAALGQDRVAQDPATLDRYARTTQNEGTRPCCVLYPRTTEEVREVVTAASKHGVVVYPISRGKNWGYGDACAPSEGAAIVDLSKMNRILEVNTELAYCVVEPGVSQGQLHEYLQDNQTGLWMDCTGAGPDASLVGNTVDRGFGHTRYGDHFLTCSGMEIVLADGRVLETGFGQYANTGADRVYRYGIGPFLDGLFCQSNFGIVTKIGLWLMPEPEVFTAFYFQVPKHEDLAELIDRVRPLRLSGVLQSAIHIGNDLRLLSVNGRYPWKETGGKTPLPKEVREALRRKFRIHPWQGSGSISGTAAQVRATRKALRKALRGLTSLRFVNDRTLRWGGWAVKGLQALGLGESLAFKLRTVRPQYALLKGTPSMEHLAGTQWRLRGPEEPGPRDPLDLGCGLYWLSPVLPMTGRDAMKLVNVLEPIFEAHGFDMLASLNLLNERSLIGIFNIAFDQSVEGEPGQALACYEALVDASMAAGYPLYRCGLQGMEKVRGEGAVFWDVAEKIKAALDPKDVIARGRYIPPLHRAK